MKTRESYYGGTARQRLATARDAIDVALRLLHRGDVDNAEAVLLDASVGLETEEHEERIAYAVCGAPARRTAIPAWMRRLVLDRSRGVCAICLDPVFAADQHIDHIIPVHRGGPTSPDNLRLTHRRCNLARRYEEWAAVDEFMARGGVI